MSPAKENLKPLHFYKKKYYDSLLSINGDKGGKAVITAHRDDTAVLKVNDVKELTDMDVKL